MKSLLRILREEPHTVKGLVEVAKRASPECPLEQEVVLIGSLLSAASIPSLWTLIPESLVLFLQLTGWVTKPQHQPCEAGDVFVMTLRGVVVALGIVTRTCQKLDPSGVLVRLPHFYGFTVEGEAKHDTEEVSFCLRLHG